MEIAGQDAELPEIRRRAKLFGVFVVVAFIAVLGRLFYLQLIEGDAFYKLTSDSIVRTLPLPAVRGQVRDRKNRVLATIRPSFDVVVSPRQVTYESFQRVSTVLGKTAAEAAEDWDRIQKEKKDKERSITLAEDISHEAMAAIETSLDKPGIRIESVARRTYPYGLMSAHVVGFMNEISADELLTRKDEGYRAGDLIGRSGVERQWEAYLRGRQGFEKVVIDRRGIRKTVNIRELVDGAVRQEPQAGNNVVLTLDIELQKIVDRALRNHRAAAAVVLDVNSGRVLAMLSRPQFDPNQMSGHLTAEQESRILADPFRPLRDKTLAETYYPGSTFKVISTLAALEDRIITPGERTKCRGSLELGRRRFKCTKAHGTVNLHDAIVRSCNVYYYELGARPGMLDRLAKAAANGGLGAPTGLGLNGEEGGFMPTEEWFREQKRKNPKAEGFQVGHALNAAIGQGSTRVTVLQMALLYAAIANGGKLWLPQIVERIESPEGEIIQEFAPRVRRELAVTPEHLAILRDGLYGVVNESNGTAYRARVKGGIEVAGKTGTAQVRRITRKNESSIPLYERNDHAWFMGYAPAGDPKIAFAIVVEHGGHGGEVAAPAAMDIVQSYFETIAPTDRQAPKVSVMRRKAMGSRRAEPDAGGAVPRGSDDQPPVPAPAPEARPGEEP